MRAKSDDIRARLKLLGWRRQDFNTVGERWFEPGHDAFNKPLGCSLATAWKKIKAVTYRVEEDQSRDHTNGPMKPKPKRVALNLRLPQRLHARLKALAKKNHRSLNGEIISVLTTSVRSVR